MFHCCCFQAYLRAVDLEELIATDMDDYISIAMKVASDKSYRQQLSDILYETRHRLFHQQVNAKLFQRLCGIVSFV